MILANFITRKTMRYVFLFLISIIISKYLILWFLPISSAPTASVEKKVQIPGEVSSSPEPDKKEVKLTIDYSGIKQKVESEYQTALNDIDGYINEQIDGQRDSAYYQLTKEDGFLDWIFGYFTGYKMMWKKIKGAFGSNDNEVKMVSDKFLSDVVNPNYNTMVPNIQSYSANRIDDYYKSIVTITSKYLNEKTADLKQQGYSNIKIEQASVPWSKYIVSISVDGLALFELTGVTSVSVLAGKVVGAKVAVLLGPKMLGLITAKSATVAAGKITASFSLIFAPLVDVAMNEASKQIQYDNTKKDFEKMIDNILKDSKKDIGHQVHAALREVKDTIYKELNKQTQIKANK